MAYSKHITKKHRDVYAEVTNAIIKQIEDGLADGKWTKPWASTSAGGSTLPHSIANRAYRGINVPILMGAAQASGYASNLWGTYKAWQGAGAQVRKGQRGTLVVFWKRIEVEDKDTSEKKKLLFAKGYSVFTAEQVEGFDLAGHRQAQIDKLPCLAQRLDHVEETTAAYFQAEAITLGHGGGRAFYSPGEDHVQMPLHEAFKSTEGYYGTLLHEAGHSTGHDKRLDRDFSGRFGNAAYAFEELVAELASAMTCGALGIEDQPREDHAQYVRSWLETLKGDKRAIFTAASQAQKAADLILAHEAEAQGEGIEQDMREAA